jgi:putative hemolysin
MLLAVAVIAFLILINAFYVAAEFAAVRVSPGRIRRLRDGGDGRAGRLLPVLEDGRRLDRYIGLCQVGITLSSLALGAFSQVTVAAGLAPHFGRWFGLSHLAAQSASSFSVLFGVAALQVVLGELVPKSLALQHPTRLALFTAAPMRWSGAVLGWFNALLNGSGLLLLKLLRLAPTGHRHVHSPEEIEFLIAESGRGGLLKPEAHRRLRRALHLGRRTAHQIMVPRVHVEGVDLEEPPSEVLRRAAQSPYSRLPAYRGSLDNVVGMLHAKDLALQQVERAGLPSIEDLLRPVLFVHELMTAERILRLFRERRVQQAVVVDEFGGLAGLVTLGDVMEELMGEMADELKSIHPPPERLPDGRVRLPGLMRLEEAERWVGVRWEGGAETVGGHVTWALAHPPAPGERVTIGGIPVQVERTRRGAVLSVLAGPLATEGGSDG